MQKQDFPSRGYNKKSFMCCCARLGAWVLFRGCSQRNQRKLSCSSWLAEKPTRARSGSDYRAVEKPWALTVNCWGLSCVTGAQEAPPARGRLPSMRAGSSAPWGGTPGKHTRVPPNFSVAFEHSALILQVSCRSQGRFETRGQTGTAEACINARWAGAAAHLCPLAIWPCPSGPKVNSGPRNGAGQASLTTSRPFQH